MSKISAAKLFKDSLVNSFEPSSYLAPEISEEATAAEISSRLS